MQMKKRTEPTASTLDPPDLPVKEQENCTDLNITIRFFRGKRHVDREEVIWVAALTGELQATGLVAGIDEWQAPLKLSLMSVVVVISVTVTHYWRSHPRPGRDRNVISFFLFFSVCALQLYRL